MYDDVMSLTTRPLVAFLQLNHRGTNLGCLHIRLDGLPGYVQQYQELATGSSGRGSYRGARFDIIGNNGEPGERVGCCGFMNVAGARESAAIRQVEDYGSVSTPVTEGVVFGAPGQHAGFGIITQGSSNTWTWPVIGHVTSGMSDLKAAVAKYDAEDILFTETGVIFDARD
ncbi:unnamed protein product [Meganyctiphanes norvegica]|uniref:Peptidylprolyl isomerase n=1 Tax=Meganyctiphanes norvegica TaxID=48144 RepID=A0AAV2PWQ7_MEGNR